MKSIVVMAPNNLDDIIYSFPLLKRMDMGLDDCSIHLIISEKFRSYVSFFSLARVRIHLIHREIKNIFEAHKCVVNLNEILNVDFYLDLNGKFLTTFMGINFRSKCRIGSVTNWYKIFLHKNVKNSGIDRSDHYFMNFFKTLSDDSEANFFISLPENKKRRIFNDSPLITDSFDFELLVYFADSEPKFLEDLLDLFPRAKIYLFSPLTITPKKNIVVMEDGLNGLEQIFNQVHAICTDVRWLMSLSIFKNKKIFPFVQTPRAIPLFTYLNGPTDYILFENDSLLEIARGRKKHKIVVNDEVADFITDEIIEYVIPAKTK